MILITGGIHQGKTALAESLRDRMQETGPGNAEIIPRVHLIIAGEMRAGRDPRKKVEALMQRHPNAIFTVDELGCGIVPADPFDRAWREATGRISCLLAERAETVYRVTCGIAARIK